MRERKRLVLDLLLIGWISGASFVGQWQNEAMQNESKNNLLSTALIVVNQTQSNYSS